MEVALAVIQAINAILVIRDELESNFTECMRLCDRIAVLSKPVQGLLDNNKAAEKKSGLSELLSVLQESEKFVTRYTNKSVWNMITKISFRSAMGSELGGLNNRLNRCILDLQLSLVIDFDMRRAEDLDDLKKSFEKSLKIVLDELKSGSNVVSSTTLADLQKDIKDNQDLIVKLLKERRYEPLSGSEITSMKLETDNLLSSTTKQFNDIMSSLARIENDQHHIVNLIEGMNLSRDQESRRSEMLKGLTLSHSHIVKGDTPIAEGHFGEVYVGKYRQKHMVAIKVMRNKGRMANERLTDAQIHSAESEILLMDYLKDPSIVLCHGYLPDPHELMIVLDLAPFGSLHDFISGETLYPTLPSSLCLAWLSDLADALKHIHAKSVVHKDVKCENLLVFADLKIKLCDFGLSKRTTGAAQSSIAGAGTVGFMAPEIRNGRKSTPASDMFSFAATAVQMFSRQPPRSEDIIKQIKDSLSLCDFGDQSIKSRFIQLLCKCAMIEPSHRPTSSDVAQRLAEFLDVSAYGDPRVNFAEGNDAIVTQQIIQQAKEVQQSILSMGKPTNTTKPLNTASTAASSQAAASVVANGNTNSTGRNKQIQPERVYDNQLKADKNTGMIIRATCTRYGTDTHLADLASKWRNHEVLNEADANGFTPLHIAVMLGNANKVRSLVENGANPDLKTKQMVSFYCGAMDSVPGCCCFHPRGNANYVVGGSESKCEDTTWIECCYCCPLCLVSFGWAAFYWYSLFGVLLPCCYPAYPANSTPADFAEMFCFECKRAEMRNALEGGLHSPVPVGVSCCTATQPKFCCCCG